MTKHVPSSSYLPSQMFYRAETKRDRKSLTTSRTAWRTKVPALVCTSQACQEQARQPQLWKWCETLRKSTSFLSYRSMLWHLPTLTLSTQSFTSRLQVRKRHQQSLLYSWTSSSKSETNWSSWTKLITLSARKGTRTYKKTYRHEQKCEDIRISISSNKSTT